MNEPSKHETIIIGLERIVRQFSVEPREVQLKAQELAADASMTATGKTVQQRFNDVANVLLVAVAPIFEAAELDDKILNELDKSDDEVQRPAATPLPPGPPVPRHIPISPALDRSKH